MNAALKWVSRTLVGIAVLILLVRSLDTLTRRSARLPTPPLTNGYVALVVVAQQGIARPGGDVSGIADAEIQALRAANRASFGRVRAAAAMETCVVRPEARQASREHEADLAGLKALGHLFVIEFKGLMLDGKTNEAGLCQIDLIRLGRAIGRGGDRTDTATGLLLELVGASTLGALVPQLDAATCKRAAADLGRLEQTRDSGAQVVANDRAWTRYRFGLVGLVGDLLSRRTLEARHAELRQRWDEAAHRSRRLALRLAARAFELDSGKPPARPADLVPGYLPAVPIDPKTGAPFPDLPAEGH
jgi:hypothetical protein